MSDVNKEMVIPRLNSLEPPAMAPKTASPKMGPKAGNPNSTFAVTTSLLPTNLAASPAQTAAPTVFSAGSMLSSSSSLMPKTVSSKLGRASSKIETTLGVSSKIEGVNCKLENLGLIVRNGGPSPRGSLERSSPRGSLERSSPRGSLERSSPRGSLERTGLVHGVAEKNIVSERILKTDGPNGNATIASFDESVYDSKATSRFANSSGFQSGVGESDIGESSIGERRGSVVKRLNYAGDRMASSLSRLNVRESEVHRRDEDGNNEVLLDDELTIRLDTDTPLLYPGTFIWHPLWLKRLLSGYTRRVLGIFIIVGAIICKILRALVSHESGSTTRTLSDGVTPRWLPRASKSDPLYEYQWPHEHRPSFCENWGGNSEADYGTLQDFVWTIILFLLLLFMLLHDCFFPLFCDCLYYIEVWFMLASLMRRDLSLIMEGKLCGQYTTTEEILHAISNFLFSLITVGYTTFADSIRVTHKTRIVLAIILTVNSAYDFIYRAYMVDLSDGQAHIRVWFWFHPLCYNDHVISANGYILMYTLHVLRTSILFPGNSYILRATLRRYRIENPVSDALPLSGTRLDRDPSLANKCGSATSSRQSSRQSMGLGALGSRQSDRQSMGLGGVSGSRTSQKSSVAQVRESKNGASSVGSTHTLSEGEKILPDLEDANFIHVDSAFTTNDSGGLRQSRTSQHQSRTSLRQSRSLESRFRHIYVLIRKSLGVGRQNSVRRQNQGLEKSILKSTGAVGTGAKVGNAADIQDRQSQRQHQSLHNLNQSIGGRSIGGILKNDTEDFNEGNESGILYDPDSLERLAEKNAEVNMSIVSPPKKEKKKSSESSSDSNFLSSSSGTESSAGSEKSNSSKDIKTKDGSDTSATDGSETRLPGMATDAAQNKAPEAMIKQRSILTQKSEATEARKTVEMHTNEFQKGFTLEESMDSLQNDRHGKRDRDGNDEDINHDTDDGLTEKLTEEAEERRKKKGKSPAEKQRSERRSRRESRRKSRERRESRQSHRQNVTFAAVVGLSEPMCERPQPSWIEWLTGIKPTQTGNKWKSESPGKTPNAHLKTSSKGISNTAGKSSSADSIPAPATLGLKYPGSKPGLSLTADDELQKFKEEYIRQKVEYRKLIVLLTVEDVPRDLTGRFMWNSRIVASKPWLIPFTAVVFGIIWSLSRAGVFEDPRKHHQQQHGNLRMPFCKNLHYEEPWLRLVSIFPLMLIVALIFHNGFSPLFWYCCRFAECWLIVGIILRRHVSMALEVVDCGLYDNDPESGSVLPFDAILTVVFQTVFGLCVGVIVGMSDSLQSGVKLKLITFGLGAGLFFITFMRRMTAPEAHMITTSDGNGDGHHDYRSLLDDKYMRSNSDLDNMMIDSHGIRNLIDDMIPVTTTSRPPPIVQKKVLLWIFKSRYSDHIWASEILLFLYVFRIFFAYYQGRDFYLISASYKITDLQPVIKDSKDDVQEGRGELHPLHNC